MATLALAACGPGGGDSGSDNDSGDDSTSAASIKVASTVSLDGLWSDAGPVEDVTGNAGAPAMDALGSGEVVAVWPHRDGFNFSVRARIRASDGTWSATDTLENATDSLPTYIEVDSNGKGQAMAVWQQDNQIWAALYNGTSWGATTQVDESSNSASVYEPDIAIDATGDGFVAWQQEDAEPVAHLWSSRFIADKSGWSEATLLESEDQTPATTPAVTTVSGDQGVVIWVEDSGSEAKIKHSTFSEL